MIQTENTRKILLEFGALLECPFDYLWLSFYIDHKTYEKGLKFNEDGYLVCHGYVATAFAVNKSDLVHPICARCPIRGKVLPLDRATYNQKLN